jgi:hypothetical protein
VRHIRAQIGAGLTGGNGHSSVALMLLVGFSRSWVFVD